MGTTVHELRQYTKDPVLSDVLLSEAYIGKTDTLKEIEAKIHKLRKETKSITNNVNQSKTMLEINRLFEKQFGMDIFALCVDPTDTYNAYTYTIGRRFDMTYRNMRQFVVGDVNNGYRFREGNGLCILVHINYGLLADKDFSDEEIMAIILHEVGHNFGDCLYDKLELFNKNMMEGYKSYLVFMAILSACVLFVPGVLAAGKEYLKYNNKRSYKKEKSRQKKSKKNIISGWLSGVAGTISDKYMLYTDCLNRILGGATFLKLSKSATTDSQKEAIKNSINRQAEIIADKFPDIYGYGVANSSIHVKFSDVNKNKAYQMLKKSPFAKANFNYQKELFDIYDFDEHPNTVQRIISNLNSLEREYAKKDLDPKVKAELKAQIEEIKKILNEITDESKKVSKIEKAQANYFAYVKNECPESISKELEDNIEEILDDALEEANKKYNKRK